MRLNFGIAALLAAPLVLAGAPLSAETPAQLDALSRASDQPGTGIALARKQIAHGELLDAMATLERVLMNDPDNDEARALHAGLLCRIDDKRGAMVEFDTMRGRDVPQNVSDEAREPCRQGG
jgi:Flp pilus assembly protein TadD